MIAGAKELILQATPQVFNWVRVWAVSKPVKNCHLVFCQIFRNHFRFVTWCAMNHENRGIVHSHVYYSVIPKAVNIFQAIRGSAWGKKIQLSSPMASQTIWFENVLLYRWNTLQKVFAILVFKHASSALQMAEQ